MKKTLTTSQVAQMIKERFPMCEEWYHPNEIFIFDEEGGYGIYAKEMPSGCSKVIVKGVPYSKMNAQEKKDAVEFILNAEIEKVTIKSSCEDGIYISYNLKGTYMTYINGDCFVDWQKKINREKLISIEEVNL